MVPLGKLFLFCATLLASGGAGMYGNNVCLFILISGMIYRLESLAGR